MGFAPLLRDLLAGDSEREGIEDYEQRRAAGLSALVLCPPQPKFGKKLLPSLEVGSIAVNEHFIHVG